MKLIIHDLGEKEFKKLGVTIPKNTMVFSPAKPCHPCISCFCCWVRTPGYCILRDDYLQMGEVFSKADELVIISKCSYGSYSPFVKNVLDRSLAFFLPFYEQRNGRVYNGLRYDNRISMTVHMYGTALTEAEKETARELVEVNSRTLNSTGWTIAFHDAISELKGAVL